MTEPNNSLAIDCPNWQSLEAFALGQMPVAEIDALGKHIVECPRCDSLLDTLHKNRKTVFSPLRQAARRTSGKLGELLAEPEYKEFEAHVCGIRFGVSHEDELTKLFVPGRSGDSLPAQIARYLISREIGRGGFATVYLGHDPDHRRQVAVKILRRDRFASARVRESFLSEAQIVATLEHPSIVPVLDWGTTDEFGPYVVMEYIDGRTLAEAMAARQLDRQKLVEIVTVVAQALHHAHKLGLVHRDVKPQNILIDAENRPFVADFGLAIRDEEQWNHRGELAGTRSYMAPEQVRRESHRLDGRTDLWALGVILFQALTNRQPFSGKSAEQFDDEIQHRDPKPLRQIDDTIPEDLERICLKCLSKKMTDRYSTALDLAKDLQQATQPRPPAATAIPIGSTTVVPRGIRAFGPEDQHFFIDLLPGPRDGTGIPDSIRSWKARLEFADPATDASIAVLYGPSGCGKSSFVRAGLLPRLESHVVHAYIDAGGQNFEQRLLKTLKHACRDIPQQASLIETIARLRTGRHFPARRTKCVVVLDQFEQWLHCNREVVDAPLVQALRQCDGEHVQCLILVRDDFWMAVSRFMSALEIPLLEGKNCAAVDLFDARHAQRVLTLFGRAQGNLPASPVALTAEQKSFLQSAVEDLDSNGRVVCVRLALFAEMVKAKPWAPRTLTQLGGVKGVGVTFLEESFGRSAPARHRLFPDAIRAILAALLPDDETEIRAQAQSREHLLAISGCGPSGTHFDEILGILDLELRLITPVDVEPADVSPAGSDSDLPPSGQYYQLTHDYLVPSIRDWLNRKRRETLRGRAELLLDERARLWNATGDRKQLPSLLEWMRIRCLTRQRDWNPRERQLIQMTSRYHGARVAIGLAALTIMIGVAVAAYGHVRGAWLINNLQTAETANIETVVRQIQNNSFWTRGKLRSKLKLADPDQQFRFDIASFALGDPVDLTPAVLRSSPQEMQLILKVLELHHANPEFSQRLWRVLKDETAPADARFRAACALANLDLDREDWAPLIAEIADLYLRQEQHLADEWIELLRPIGPRLIDSLQVHFLKDEAQDRMTRSLAALALAEFCEKDQDKLISLLKSSDTDQDLFLRKLEHDRSNAVERLEAAFLQTNARPDNPADRDRDAVQRARLGTALVLLGKPNSVWPALEHQPDPSRRICLVNQFAAWRVDPLTMWNHLKETSSSGVRYALILALGEYPPKDVLPKLDSDAPTYLLRLCQEDPDSGVHSATDWLLRTWNLPHGDVPAQVPNGPKKHWLVDKEGHTMAEISTPGAFLMGSPAEEADRREDEMQHTRRIDYSYAISTTPVTVAQFRRSGCIDRSDPNSDTNCPIDNVDIAEAIRYCNWLSMQNEVPFDQWCYELREDAGKRYLHPVEGMLSKTGYRLPTEAEWEYACRAGTTTRRFCGDSLEALSKYAWFRDNSQGRLRAAGQLRPNPYGLFDLYGNTSQWCQDAYGAYREENGDGLFLVNNGIVFAYRGCSYDSRQNVARSARRSRALSAAIGAVGFRVVRSIK